MPKVGLPERAYRAYFCLFVERHCESGPLSLNITDEPWFDCRTSTDPGLRSLCIIPLYVGVLQLEYIKAASVKNK